MDYEKGKFNIGPTSPRGAARDFLSSGLSLMGLGLLSDARFEMAIDLPPRQLELGCEGDLSNRFGCYVLRGGEIVSSGAPERSTHIPLSLVLN